MREMKILGSLLIAASVLTVSVGVEAARGQTKKASASGKKVAVAGRSSRSSSVSSTGASSASKLSTTSASVPAPTAPPKKAWTINAGADYYLKNRRDNEAFTAWTLGFSYKFNDANSARILQTATQYTVVNQNEPEFVPDDTTVQYTGRLVQDWEGFSLKVRPAFTLPVSRDSGKQGVVSRPSLSFLLGRSFLNEKLTVTYQPFYRYHINRYKTRISGAPLRQQSVGHTLILGYEITPKFSASASGQGAYNFDEPSPYEPSSVRAKGSYSFDLGLGYNIMENLDVAVGYSQGDSFIKEGRYELVLYNPNVTRYYIGLSASY